MTNKTWIEISKSALLHNVRSIKKHVAPSQVMAVVKANAYGHGIEIVSKTVAPHVQGFAVDSLKEALLLRKIGIKKPMLVLGYITPDGYLDCAKKNISFVAYSLETLSILRRLKQKPKSFKIHVKIETGTSRQGIAGEELERFIKEAKKIPSVIIEGASTHYANIEDTTDARYAMGQLKRFREALELMDALDVHPKEKHTAASAAALVYPETRFDQIRLGISLYGHWPSKETMLVANGMPSKLKLKPVLTWKTVIAQVKSVKKGTPVSYGLTEKVSRNSKLAVIPVGYWDGFDRGLSSVGTVLIKEKVCKVIGRICMNMCVVDVTDIRSPKIGDEVVIIGKQGKESITAESIASKIGSIQYEVLDRINPEIPRILVS